MYARNGKNRTGKNRFQDVPRPTASMPLLLVLCLTLAPGSPTNAADAPCCAVTAVDARMGLVKARERATGRTFEFTVSDMRQRAQLRAGQAVEADFRAQQAWLPPAKQRYRIARLSASPSTAGGKTLGPVPKGSPSTPQSSPGPAGGTGAAAQTQIAPGVLVALEAVMTEIILVGNYPGVTGGLEDSGTVLLTGPARPVQYDQGRRGIREGPPMVLLASSNPSVLRVPPGVQVPIGERVGKFTFLTYPVAQPTEVTITATFNSVSKTTTVKVVPSRLLRIEMPAAVRGGHAAEGRVVLKGPPANASIGTVKLVSANPGLVKLPASVVVPSGQTQITFPIETFGVAKDTTVAVSAAQTSGAAAEPLQKTVLLTPPVLTKAFINVGAACVSPCSTSVLLEFDGKIPAEGLPLEVKTDRPSVVAVPATVIALPSYQGGRISVPFTTVEVNSDVKATISVKAAGIAKSDRFEILKRGKPDLFIRDRFQLVDHFGNVVTQPIDSQPFKICVDVGNRWHKRRDRFQPPPFALGVDYLNSRTRTGRTYVIPISFEHPVSYGNDMDRYYVRMCIDLPGIEQGDTLEVKMIADVRKQISEHSESNNDRRFTIERK